MDAAAPQKDCDEPAHKLEPEPLKQSQQNLAGARHEVLEVVAAAVVAAAVVAMEAEVVAVVVLAVVDQDAPRWGLKPLPHFQTSKAFQARELQVDHLQSSRQQWAPAWTSSELRHALRSLL